MRFFFCIIFECIFAVRCFLQMNRIIQYKMLIKKLVLLCMVLLPITTCKYANWQTASNASISRQYCGIWVNKSFHEAFTQTGSLYKTLQKTNYRFMVIDSTFDNNQIYAVRFENYNQVSLNNSFDFQLKPDSLLKSVIHIHLPTDTLKKALYVAKISVDKEQNTLRFKTFDPIKNTYTEERFVKISPISSAQSMYLPSAYLNANILKGTYTVFNELDSMVAPNVKFMANGTIHGWQQFVGFRIEQYYEDLWQKAGTDVIELQMPGFTTGNIPPVYGAVIKIGNVVKIYSLEYSKNKNENFFEKKQLIFTLISVK